MTKSEKRKKIEEYILKVVNTLDSSKTNDKYYRDAFSKMSDADFSTFMDTVKSKKQELKFLYPNMIVTPKMQDCLNAAKLVKLELRERIKLWDSVTQQYYLTPKKYLVLQLPIRRVKQFLLSKISIPESDKKTDVLTGQVVKPDKGSSISLVEMQTILAKGLDKSILELMSVRGGNLNEYSQYKASIEDTGEVRLSELDQSTQVRAAQTAGVIFKAMHIDNTFTNENN